MDYSITVTVTSDTSEQPILDSTRWVLRIWLVETFQKYFRYLHRLYHPAHKRHVVSSLYSYLSGGLSWGRFRSSLRCQQRAKSSVRCSSEPAYRLKGSFVSSLTHIIIEETLTKLLLVLSLLRKDDLISTESHGKLKDMALRKDQVHRRIAYFPWLAVLPDPSQQCFSLLLLRRASPQNILLLFEEVDFGIWEVWNASRHIPIPSRDLVAPHQRFANACSRAYSFQSCFCWR